MGPASDLHFGFEKQHLPLPSFFSVNCVIQNWEQEQVWMQNNALECLVINFQKEVHLISKVLVWRVSVNKHRETLKVLNVFSVLLCAYLCLCVWLSDSLVCLAFIFHSRSSWDWVSQYLKAKCISSLPAFSEEPADSFLSSAMFGKYSFVLLISNC